MREIEHSGARIETGPLRIGDDWTGVFIRGDNAIHYALHLRAVLADIPDSNFAKVIIAGLAELLESSNEASGR